MSVENNDMLQRVSSMPVVEGLLGRIRESVPIDLLSGDFAGSKLTTEYHSRETAHLFSKILETLNLTPSIEDSMMLGALTHDVGKGRLPADILYGSNILTDEDRKLVATHPYLSAMILSEARKNDMISKNHEFAPRQWNIAIGLAALHHTYKNNEDRNYPVKKLIRDLRRSGVVSKETLEMIDDEYFGEFIAICDVFSAAGGRAYSAKRAAQENQETTSSNFDIEENASIKEKIVLYEIKTSPIGRQALKIVSSEYILING